MSTLHSSASLSRASARQGAAAVGALGLACALSGCFVVDASLYEALPTGADAGFDGETNLGVDAGPPDLGPPDLGPEDAGPPDLGVDAGPPRPIPADVCGAASTPVLAGTTRSLKIDTTDATGGSLTVMCGGSAAVGNDRFFAIDVAAGEYWHFHVAADPLFAPTETTRNPIVYVVAGDGAGGCNDRPANCAAVFANSCAGRADEHFAFIAPSTGRFFIGIDDATPGGGHYQLDAFRPQCGNGLQEHGESCDDLSLMTVDGGMSRLVSASGTCSQSCRKQVGATSMGTFPSEAEFNDNSVEANQVQFAGAVTTVEINGDVGGGGDCYPDVFEVRVETMGTDIRVDSLTSMGTDCTSPSSALYTLQLRDALGNPRGMTVMGATCPSIDAQNLPAGVYTVWIRATDPAATAPAPYRLRITRS